MNLSKILDFCGIKDNRIRVENNVVVQQGKSHEGLEDCKLEGECIYRIRTGRGLFKEYSQFKIPKYLRRAA